jgi:hypothetical protein
LFSFYSTNFTLIYLLGTISTPFFSKDITRLSETDDEGKPKPVEDVYGRLHSIPPACLFVAGTSCKGKRILFVLLLLIVWMNNKSQFCAFVLRLHHTNSFSSDFSMLKTTYRKDIEDKGQSGQTFLAAVEYLELYAPPFAIFENVVGAPWDKVRQTNNENFRRRKAE